MKAQYWSRANSIDRNEIDEMGGKEGSRLLGGVMALAKVEAGKVSKHNADDCVKIFGLVIGSHEIRIADRYQWSKTCKNCPESQGGSDLKGCRRPDDTWRLRRYDDQSRGPTGSEIEQSLCGCEEVIAVTCTAHDLRA